jgi:hypothetical protein
MNIIGVVQQLQVQPDGLKPGDGRTYEPSRLAAVEGLRLEPEGVIGLDLQGKLLDIHHARHPHSKYRSAINPVSINFTGHYVLMQERFGDHLAFGCAGENILIACTRRFEEAELGGGVALETADGGLAWLRHVCAATPCVPFSEYALQAEMRPPPEMMKETLQFLDNGRRGFYCRLDGAPSVIRTGARVYLPE